MANRFWVGGSATWDGTAGTKWSTTSGGAGGAAVPTLSDDVFFNAASGVVTVTRGAGTVSHNLDFTGFSGTFQGSNGSSIYGNLTLSAAMTYTETGSMTFLATSGTQLITTNGKSMLNTALTVNTTGSAHVQLADNLMAISATLTLTQGVFDAGGKNLTIAAFSSSNTNVRTFIGGSGFIDISGTGTVFDTGTTTNLNFNASDHRLNFNNAGSAARTINTGNINIGETIISAGTGLMTFSATVSTFNGLSFLGFKGTFADADVTMIGDLTFDPGMTVAAGVKTFTLTATSGTQNIATNGTTVGRSFNINTSGGAIVFLQDNLNMPLNVMTFTAGGLNLNSKTLTCVAFASSNSNIRQLTMDDATVVVTGFSSSWDLTTTTNLTFSATGSIIEFTNPTTNGLTFAGGGLIYGTLWINRGAGTANTSLISGSNTFEKIKYTGTGTNTIQFLHGTTNSFGSWEVSGSAGNIVTISSDTTATHALVCTGSYVIADYLNIQHSVASGAAFYAGPNSVNNQAVVTAGSGWIFGPVPLFSRVGRMDDGYTDFGADIYFEMIDRWRAFTDIYAKQKAIGGMSVYTQNAGGTLFQYQVDKDSPNKWTEIDTIKEEGITLFSNMDTDDFNVIRFRVTGNTSGTPMIFKAIEVLSLNDKGFAEN